MLAHCERQSPPLEIEHYEGILYQCASAEMQTPHEGVVLCLDK